VYVNRSEGVVVHAAAVTAEREDISADGNCGMIDASRTTEQMNGPIHCEPFDDVGCRKNDAELEIRTDDQARSERLFWRRSNDCFHPGLHDGAMLCDAHCRLQVS
jgi:hypothetical protein